MYRVTRVDPISWAKNTTLAALAVVLFLVVLSILPALLAVAYRLAGGLDAEAAAAAALMLAGGLLALILLSFAVAIGAFLVGLVQGVAFNWALGRTGGLRVGLALDAAAGGQRQQND